MSLFDKLTIPAESLYNSSFSLIVHKSVKDENTGITSFKTVISGENIPCRISYKSVPSTSQSDTGAALTQSIKLFCSPNVEILPGSKIVVMQNSATTSYKAAGKPAVYASHQEVELVLEKEWA